MDIAHTVYGLRLHGEREVRYVGMTRGPVDSRKFQHIYKAAGTQSATPFGVWLRDNREQIETFEIARCQDREEAKAVEKVAVNLCEQLGQQIFNRALTKASRR